MLYDNTHTHRPTTVATALPKLLLWQCLNFGCRCLNWQCQSLHQILRSLFFACNKAGLLMGKGLLNLSVKGVVFRGILQMFY